MLKKLAYMGIALAMLFSLAGLSACVEPNIELKQGIYITDDGIGRIELYGDNLFSFSLIYMSYLPTGNYTVKDDKLTLCYTDNSELIFEIQSDRIIFVDAYVEGLPIESRPVEIGTVFKLSDIQELKQGTYVTDDGLASLTLFEDCNYIFNRHLGTSYHPSGSYSIVNGKLILYIEDKEEFVFNIENDQLIFVSGQLAEPFIESGTIFTL